MDDLPLISMLAANANILTYQLTSGQSNIKMLASFEHLTSRDFTELQGSSWIGAKFRDVWLAWLDEEHTYKLVVRHDAEKDVQGIVRLGR